MDDSLYLQKLLGSRPPVRNAVTHPDRFWIVVGPDITSGRYNQQGDAEKRAKELAAAKRGTKYYVMASVAVAEETTTLKQL